LLVAVRWLLVAWRSRRRLGRLNVDLPLPLIIVARLAGTDHFAAR
jgi:hypothetical protein